MKNGAWTPMDFDRFSALREYDTHRLVSKENGIDIDDMASRREFVRLLLESGTADPFRFTQNFIKKQTEEARKKNYNNNKRKSHGYKGKGKEEIEELDDDDYVSAADRFPFREGYHNLDLNNPKVRAEIEEHKKKVSVFLEEKAKEKARELEQKLDKRRSREEARKNNLRKTHGHKDKGKKMEELGNDVSADDRFPIRRGNHELDFNDPEVKARVEEKKRRAFASRDKLEKAKEKENGAWIQSGHRNPDRQNQKAKSEANPRSEMKNGAWTPMDFARFSALREYDNFRLYAKHDGLDPRDLVSSEEFVRLFLESGTVDPFQFTQNFIKKQTEEARKNIFTYKRKSHAGYKGKGKEIEEERDNDADRFPIRKGYHGLDLSNPEVKARIEAKKKKVAACLREMEEEEAMERDKRRRRRRRSSSRKEY